MSGSTKHGAYDPLPVTTPEIQRFSSSQRSPASGDEKGVRPQSDARHLIRHWRWEIATFALGTGAFVSIVALLVRYHEKPAPRLPLGSVNIQLTAVIAALTQVAQSALLVSIASCIAQLKWNWFRRTERIIDLDRFDQASRGPDGSMRLIWHLKGRQRLVTLGALATVLMLFFQTFTQQAVHIGPKQITLNNTEYAGMQRSISIFEDPSDTKTFSLPTSNGTFESYKIDTAHDAALRRGVMGYELPSGIYGDSVSGMNGDCRQASDYDCTWPSLNTLALCVSTTNISIQIIQDGDRVVLPALTSLGSADAETPSFQSGTYVYDADGDNSSTSIPSTSATKDTNLPNLAEQYLFYYDACGNGEKPFNKSDPKNWSAFKGVYQFCIQKQSAETSNGFTLSDLLTSTTALQWSKKTMYNDSAYCTNVDGEETDFCVGESAMEDLSRQMHSILNISADYQKADYSDIKYSSEWGPYLFDQVISGANCPGTFSPKSKRSWGGNSNYNTVGWRFDYTISGVAQSLNDAFRRNYLNDTVYGDYTYSETVLLVNFYWFILPAIVYVITAFFFIATIFMTRNTPLWKSSHLPLLHATKENGALGSADHVKQYAGENSMRLVRTTTGWQLVEGGDVRERLV